MKLDFARLLGALVFVTASCGGGGGNSNDPDGGDGGDADVVASLCAQAIIARGPHTCSVSDAGAVVCWGRNHRGQLGNNSMSDSASPVEAALPDGVHADEVVTGVAHSCARAGGNVYCWGFGADGVLGDGTVVDSPTPRQVSTIDDAKTIVSGGFHVCAIRADDSLWCWGDNVAGQIGNGLSGENDATEPVMVASGIANAAGGEEHTCAQTAAGGLQCWGRNTEGQLGDESMNPSPTPVDVLDGAASPVTGVTAVWAGAFHTCAIIGGTLRCWGRNDAGQIAGAAGANATSPQEVAGVSATKVAAGELHSCALTTGGSVVCWGGNGTGQLGAGDTSARAGITTVAGLSGVDDLAAGDLHTCVLIDSEVQCWGQGSTGQLGTGSFDSSTSPTPASFTCDG